MKPTLTILLAFIVLAGCKKKHDLNIAGSKIYLIKQGSTNYMDYTTTPVYIDDELKRNLVWLNDTTGVIYNWQSK